MMMEKKERMQKVKELRAKKIKENFLKKTYPKHNCDMKQLTIKKEPVGLSFPRVTERVFADLKHKITVPSPDAYYPDSNK